MEKSKDNPWELTTEEKIYAIKAYLEILMSDKLIFAKTEDNKPIMLGETK
jgi:hypothetical protein